MPTEPQFAAWVVAYQYKTEIGVDHSVMTYDDINAAIGAIFYLNSRPDVIDVAIAKTMTIEDAIKLAKESDE